VDGFAGGGIESVCGGIGPIGEVGGKLENVREEAGVTSGGKLDPE